MLSGLGLLWVSGCSHERIAQGEAEVTHVWHPTKVQDGDFLIEGSEKFPKVGDALDEYNSCWLDFSREDFWRDQDGLKIRSVTVTLSLKVTGSAYTDALYLGGELIKHPFREVKITNGQSTQLFEDVEVTCNDPIKLARITEHLRANEGKVKLRYLDDATLYRAKVKFWVGR